LGPHQWSWSWSPSIHVRVAQSLAEAPYSECGCWEFESPRGHNGQQGVNMASGKGVNIYFPRQLLEQMEEMGIENISAICQEAIRAEIEKATRSCSRCGAPIQPKVVS
jgi:hypothetical protein